MIKKSVVTLKCGLEVTVLKFDDFSSIYCGIGTKFGGANLSYTLDNEERRITPGTAHFLEHKKFMLDDGIDAMKVFSKYGDANAFTSRDKTIYYFENVIDYKESLKTLLKMYFTPYFDKKGVENEKKIIISEYKDHQDDVYTRISNYSLSRLYPGDDYTKPILGNISNIKSITKESLEEAYSLFYTPHNSKLVIAGRVDDDIIDYIDECLEGIVFSTLKPVKKSYIKSKAPLKPITKHFDIYNEELILSLRMDWLNNKNPIVLDKIGAVLDSLVAYNSPFYHELLAKGLIENDIDYYIDCHGYSTYLQLEAESKKPSKLAKVLMDKLTSLTEDDISKYQIEQYIKYKKRSLFKTEDSVRSLGAKYLSLLLEDDDYYRAMNEILELDYNKVIEVFKDLKNALYTYLVVKPKNV